MHQVVGEGEEEKRRRAAELFAKARASEVAGDYEQAVRCYRAAFRLDPTLDEGGSAASSSSSARVPAEVKRYTTIERGPPVGFRTFDGRLLLDQDHRLATAQAIQAYMRAEGYVVVDHVMDDSEVRQAVDYLQLFLQSIDESVTVTATATAAAATETAAGRIIATRIASSDTGIAANVGAGQSRMNWYVRSRPLVKSSFRVVLGMAETDKLITSFDGFNLLVNPESHKDGGGLVDESWLHFDAEGYLAAGYVQGLVNLLDNTAETEASFVVFPRSHASIFPVLMPGPGVDVRESSGFHYGETTDFIKMAELDIQERPFRVPLGPGSLVMWYSGTMHCNVGCIKRAPSDAHPDQLLRRVATYVCMMPDPHTSEVTERRKELFAACVSTGHQPDWGHPSGSGGTPAMQASGAVIASVDQLPAGAAELL
eukprot:TRINITY_DN3131_c0_g1_i1.p1 TRINITY_DN3131_c0_g1~~TRINITY_DN3131_c0_g1_i1.p1  ORF type:complete len:462 (+),score=85.16 TRINITY_DN3131_c0_g1_i1:109-1386(+)